MRRVRAPWLFRVGTRGQFALARRLFQTEERLRKAGRWRQELRAGCWDGARVLISDDHHRLRAVFEEAGSEDNLATLRYFFDEHERLRLLYVDYADVDGGAIEWLMAVDVRGALSACHRHVVHPSDLPGPDLCRDVAQESDRLDPTVRSAVRVRPPRSSRSRTTWELLDVDAASLRAPCR